MKKPGPNELPLGYLIPFLILALVTIATFGVAAPVTVPIMYWLYKNGKEVQEQRREDYENWRQSIENQARQGPPRGDRRE